MAGSSVLNGTLFEIKLRTGLGTPDTYTLFTESTNFTFNETRAEIDASSKSSSGDFQGLPGQYKTTFTVDGLVIVGDATIGIMETDIRGSGTGRARRFENSVEVDQFDFLITDFTRTGPNEDVTSYSFSGTMCGQPGSIVN